MKIDDAESLRDARMRYFKATGFSEKSYNDKWVKLELGPIPFIFPNTLSRKRAIRVHDLHHVLTGYETTLIGEAEIGAWEIASGCKNYWAAWILNSAAAVMGLTLDRKRVFKAFLWGLKTNNLYGESISEELLEKSVGELRERLFLNR